jgi:hypothetical protein
VVCMDYGLCIGMGYVQGVYRLCMVCMICMTCITCMLGNLSIHDCCRSRPSGAAPEMIRCGIGCGIGVWYRCVV